MRPCSIRTRPSLTASPPVPSTIVPPTMARGEADIASDLPGIESDVDQGLATGHHRPGMDRQHDARLRRMRVTGGPAVQVEVVADGLALLDSVAAAHRALEQPTLGGMHPGEVGEVELPAV